MRSHIDPNLSLQILDLLPDAIIWVKPQFDANEQVVDFEIAYANEAANDLIKHPDGDLLGKAILKDGIPSMEGSAANFQHYHEVFTNDKPYEYTFYAPRSQRHVETMRKPFAGGVLSLTRDRRAQREAEQKERKSTRTLSSVVANSPNGVIVLDPLRNDAGVIYDFSVRHHNKKSTELLGLPALEPSQLSLKYILGLLHLPQLLNQFATVVENGILQQQELYLDQTQKWVSNTTVKIDDGLLLVFTDITELKRSQEILQKESAFSRSVFNASHNSIYVLEAVRDASGELTDFVFVQANKKYAELAGKPAEDLVGASFLQLYPYTEANGLFKSIADVVRNGKPLQAINYYASAFKKWFDIIVVPLGTEQLVVTLQEITQQREAAIQIEQQKNLLDNILRNSPSGIFVYKAIRDEQGRVQDLQCILANQAAERLTHTTQQALQKRPVLSAVPHLLQMPVFHLAVKTIETGNPFQSEYHIAALNKWMELSVAKMDDDHLIQVSTDITQTKETQQQLERSVDELKRLNENLEQFAYAASHDLKEPLRKIKFFSDRLKSQMADRLSADEQQIMDRIENAARRMGLLVDDLLEYSHVSRSAAEFEPIDLNNKVRLVLEDLELTIQEKSAKVHIEQLPIVNGNRRQLQQLFQNLISNALKYSKADEPPVVSITSKLLSGTEAATMAPAANTEKNYHLIEVTDNGIGFEQEDAERIFNVFTRLHGKSEYAGTGIGLSIARKVVENHQGFISARSEPGKGTTFSVLLPL